MCGVSAKKYPIGSGLVLGDSSLSGAKARIISRDLMYGLKPVPFKSDPLSRLHKEDGADLKREGLARHRIDC